MKKQLTKPQTKVLVSDRVPVWLFHSDGQGRSFREVSI